MSANSYYASQRARKAAQGKVLDLTPGSPEWMRRVSPSKVAAILGVSPWASQRSIYHQMRGEIPGDDESEAMERGTLCEPAVLAWWRKHHEYTGWREQVTMAIGDWCVATPDGIAEVGDHLELVEAKTAASMDDWGTPGTDEIPTYYLCQVYFAMEVAHRSGQAVERAHIPVLGGRRLLFSNYIVEYDAAIGADLMARMEAWRDQLTAAVPPLLDDTLATWNAVRRLHPEIDRGEVVQLTREQADDLVTFKHLADSSDQSLRLAKSTVIDLMGRAQYAEHAGVRIARRQSNKSGVTFVVTAKPADLNNSGGIAS